MRERWQRHVGYVLALLVAVWAVAAWPARAAAQDGKAGVQDQFFDSNGVKIRYTVQGEGEPVLLIHGFTVNIEKQWEAPGISKALARNYRVIALDNRGHGKSGKPHDPKQYGMEMVKDAVRLLDHLKIDKAHVVGYSMGAMLAARLLASYPERLRSATLGGAGALPEKAEALAFFDQLATSLEQGKGFGMLIEALTPAGQPKPTPEQLKAIDAFLTAANDTKALAAVVRGFKELTVRDQELKANKVPVLALVGALDPLKAAVDDMKERTGNLRVVVIDGADHMTAFARPEFVKELQTFLAPKQLPKQPVEKGV
jgi:pimeloyl-ACP methyl ester carboxylesterase